MSDVEIKPDDIIQRLDASSVSGGKEVEVGNYDWFESLQKSSRETETIEEKENNGIIRMRELWSNWILIFIGLIISFDIILVWMYGVGAWNFTDSKVVIAVITENFLKICGLGFLITSRLFEKIFK
jgi:hypothetical protein